VRAFSFLLPIALLIGCSSGDPIKSDGGAEGGDASDDAGPPKPATNIEHIVVVIQENHTFDTYFGRYCTAPSGSNPSCNQGPACCEAGPDKEPSGAAPVVLDDAQNGTYDPNHSRLCELAEMHGTAMDQFVTGNPCSNPSNFAYASGATVATYTDLAANGALADRYFQSIVGASSANDVYFARAGYEFQDNDRVPNAVGSACYPMGVKFGEFADATIADLLVQKGVSWAMYAEGYQAMVDANGACPSTDPMCPVAVKGYPCGFDPGDIPFAFFPSVRDTDSMRDFSRFAQDLTAKNLPSVVFVKAIGFRSEHPGSQITISAGMKFVKGVVDAVAGSSVASSTLVLVTFDEGGGYFDHMGPPERNMVDGQYYGTRVPMIAVGPFAKKNFVSHVVMEHSSVVKFIELNWLGGTGQLGTRDTTVSNIGSLLDPARTGATVPD
jgi:phospholipase C